MHIQALTFLIPLTEPIRYHNVSAMVNKEATAIGMGVYILAMRIIVVATLKWCELYRIVVQIMTITTPYCGAD